MATLGRLLLGTTWLLQPAVSVESCNTAGVSRAAFRDREAVEWLRSENEKRAPYYLKAAERMVEKGYRQQQGIDKSNSDPFIALYDAQHQVLGALDLAPNNASTWLGAGKAVAFIASLDEDRNQRLKEAMKIFARACTLEPKNVDAILQWASKKDKDEKQEMTKVKKVVGKQVTKWKNGKVPEVQDIPFLPVLEDRGKADVCQQGAAMDPVKKGSSGAADPDSIGAALSSMTVRPIFPTLITTVNVRDYLGDAFIDKLASIALKKYTAFSAMRKKAGKTDPNDINDNFFSSQATGERDSQSPQAQRFWPELYNSKEYKQLLSLMKKALLEHARKTGYELQDDERSSHMVMWAAIYLQDGGRHGYHVHQGSLASCVLYVQSPGSKTPIMFIDPRGAPPTHDYEQHLGERDFEPIAPFHHNFQFFAQAGDLVCFPSWLVHRVPSHFEKQARVAFPANLQANSAWDAWYRSSTLP